jgi:aminopeptidase
VLPSTTRFGVRHLPNLPTEEVFTTPDPLRTEGHVTSTRPLVLGDGTVIRGLRMRFEGGRAVEIDADENGGALRSRTEKDEGAARLGELALVDRQCDGELGTALYDTPLDENAASHLAPCLPPVAVDEGDATRINERDPHDFMIGSPELDVVGVVADGGVSRPPWGDWQI